MCAFGTWHLDLKKLYCVSNYKKSLWNDLSWTQLIRINFKYQMFQHNGKVLVA